MRNKRGFTLVELLVAITVLAILASLILVGLANANASAREAKTRATIAKINAVVMQKYESYRTRRVPFNHRADTFTDENGNGKYDSGEPYVDANNNGRFDTAADHARYRLDALRELMRMEMPDRFTDITDDPVTLPHRPSISEGYKNILTRTPPNGNQFQGAKCLYLLVTRGCDDPDILEQFGTNEIGTDDDGLKYFKDGWERPISFLRWAPGFFSTLQQWDLTTNLPTEHDPFDPLKVYKPSGSDPFTAAGVYPPLFPLIYSAGPDGISDIVSDQTTPIRYSTVNNNPYTPFMGELNGTPKDNDSSGTIDALDNITNHE